MMNVLSNVAAVIPVFNPEPGLMALVDKLLCAYHTVVVVDDGSIEDVDAFDSLPQGVEVLRHERNMGKGRAIKTAIAHLAAKHPEVDSAVFVDGDGQHAPEDVEFLAVGVNRADKLRLAQILLLHRVDHDLVLQRLKAQELAVRIARKAEHIDAVPCPLVA